MVKIDKIAVIGSGVMGAGIAAHIANSDTKVLLLDIAAENTKNNNQIVQNALEKISFKSSTNVKVAILGLANLEMSRKMLNKSQRDKIIIVGENFEVADYIVSNSYFISDPRTTERYNKPESFILDEKVARHLYENINYNKAFDLEFIEGIEKINDRIDNYK